MSYPQEFRTDFGGIAPGYWLWASRIRILFVIDGRIDLSSGANSFGLGFVLDTLRNSSPWWVRFIVHVAKRDGSLEKSPNPDERTFDNFRFTRRGFNLDNYDQVWFFGLHPSDNSATDEDILGKNSLDDAELRLLAQWMDRGGGVFATGDHALLGASMCSRIPRVRTMRKWTRRQGVPDRDDTTRHQTLQATPADRLIQEGDTVLQSIEVVYQQGLGHWPFVFRPVPHALLCSMHGVIDRFPDHMHEGEVIANEDVQVDLHLDIRDYDRPEYPFIVPEAERSALEGGPLRQRPLPQVIAYGRTTNPYSKPPVADPGRVAAFGSIHPGLQKRFGLVGVYDGDAVGIGRVVVDSTWHHWFSYNLVGIHKDSDQTAYQKMQAYYRNVGLWLAKPAQRRSSLTAAVWGVLTSVSPMAFVARMAPWEIGERALPVLRRTFSPCVLGEVVAAFWDPQITAATLVGPDHPPHEPSWSSLPEDLLHRVLVGSIGHELLDLALNHQERLARGERPRLDRDGIQKRALNGITCAHSLLRESIEQGAAGFSRIREALTPPTEPPEITIPIDVRRLRVVAETLQLPDARDPALIGSKVTLTIRVRLDDAVVAHDVIEDVECPAFSERGAVIDLCRDIAQVDVQTGERLSVEVLAGSWTTEPANCDALRFADSLCGDASDWIGRIAPARSQAWRLWYRVEAGERR